MGERSGIGQPLSEYGSVSRRPQPHIRGAKYARDNIDGEEPTEGTKPMSFPVTSVSSDLPQTYSADTAEDGDVVDTITVENPNNLRGVCTLDFDTIMQKQVKGPIAPILTNVGMSYDDAIHGHEKSSLSAFM